jgi:SAM-dependent methyltransferase
VATVFDPARYGRWFDTALGRLVWSEEEATLRSLLGQVAGRRVLDAGCGDGRLSGPLAEEGALVFGVDIDRRMLRAARARLAGAAIGRHLIQGDIQQLPISDHSLDVVVAVTTLCFVPNPHAAVVEFARILRSGGKIVVGELGRWSPWAASRRLRGCLTGGPWASARFWTRGELARFLAAAGIAVTDARGAVFYPRSQHLARLLGGFSRWLGKRTTVGAALVVVAGTKR